MLILLLITVFKGFFLNHTSNYCDNIDLERSTSMKFLLIHPCYGSYFFKMLPILLPSMAKQTHCIMDFSTSFSPVTLYLRLQTRGFLKTLSSFLFVFMFCFLCSFWNKYQLTQIAACLGYTELNHCFFFISYPSEINRKECFLFCKSF